MKSEAQLPSQELQPVNAGAPAAESEANPSRVTLSSVEYGLLRSSHTILSRFMQTVADQSAHQWLSSTDDLQCQVKAADFMEAMSIDSLLKHIDEGREDRRAQHHGLSANAVETALNAIVHSFCADDQLPYILDARSFADTQPANMSALHEAGGEGGDDDHIFVPEDTLRSWMHDEPAVCTECDSPTAYKRMNSRAVQLPVTEKGSMRVSSVACEVLACSRCSHEEELPHAEGALYREYGRLIATRLLTSANVDRRDMYEYLSQANNMLERAGEAMAEMLIELAETVKASDMPEGSLPKDLVIDPRSDLMILDIESEWMCNAFDLTECLGNIRCIGGLIYRTVNANELPVNPFDEDMMTDASANNRGDKPGQAPIH